MASTFNYDLAFSRNIGWFSEEEQQILKSKRVAIAGLGGVGSTHLLALIRLGITKFNLADFDEYACENTNRQAGANTQTYGVKKLDAMVDMALAINPELEINTYPDGINAENMGDFLTDVDCYVDSLDFFVLDIRQLVFQKCTEKDIPATTAAPIGMGTAYLNFLPGKMTFEQYFGLKGFTENEQYLKFFLGLTPAALQKSYLVDPTKLDLAGKKGPSTIIGCQLAAGVTATQVAKIFLNRGEVLNVPWGLHFDAYTNQFKKTWRPGGYKNPLQRLAFTFGKKILLNSPDKGGSSNNEPQSLTIAEQVLDYARWAPSGDNAQCWRFELINETSFIIFATDTRQHVVYDLDGHSSHLAHGILLETIDIAASKFSLKAHIESDISNDEHLKLSVTLKPDNSITESTLLPYIKTRAVQRRAMGTRKLTLTEKLELENALEPGYNLQWFESFDQKLAIAKLNFTNAKTRLTMKEAFSVHKEIIEWNSQFSETKIPEQALGVDWVTARLMQWMFHSWNRIEFANKYLAGTIMPRIQLDFIPSLKSSAHFALQAEKPITTTEEYIAAGRVLQRFWLTTAKLGLGFQPEQTPVIFSKYLANNINFAESDAVNKNAKKGKKMFEEIVENSENTFFLGRVGRSELPKSRSTRLPLEKLIISKNT